jgi:excisionase family DNA binding protein
VILTNNRLGGERMAVSKVRNLDDLLAVLTMEQVREVLGLSRPLVYELAHRKGFPVVRFGRALRVPRDAFLKGLEQQAQGEEFVK